MGLSRTIDDQDNHQNHQGFQSAQQRDLRQSVNPFHPLIPDGLHVFFLPLCVVCSRRSFWSSRNQERSKGLAPTGKSTGTDQGTLSRGKYQITLEHVLILAFAGLLPASAGPSGHSSECQGVSGISES